APTRGAAPPGPATTGCANSRSPLGSMRGNCHVAQPPAASAQASHSHGQLLAITRAGKFRWPSILTKAAVRWVGKQWCSMETYHALFATRSVLTTRQEVPAWCDRQNPQTREPNAPLAEVSDDGCG